MEGGHLFAGTHSIAVRREPAHMYSVAGKRAAHVCSAGRGGSVVHKQQLQPGGPVTYIIVAYLGARPLPVLPM